MSPAERSTPEAPPSPRLVGDEHGWSRVDDPAAPAIALKVLASKGAVGENAALVFFEAAEPLLVCWESAPRPELAAVTIELRFRPDIFQDPLFVTTSGADGSALRSCVTRVLREVLPRPTRDDERLVAAVYCAPRRDELPPPVRNQQPDVAPLTR